MGRESKNKDRVEGIFNEIEYFIEEKDLYEHLYEKERELLRKMSWDDWKTLFVNVG